MKKAIFLVLSVLFLSGCGCEYGESYYYNKAVDWQQREGEYEERPNGERPSRDDIIEIITQFNLRYKKEPDGILDHTDHWKTHAEVIRDGYQGDCEDLAAFCYIEIRNNTDIADSDMRIVVEETGRTDHLYLYVKTSDGEFYFDPTEADPDDGGDWFFYDSEIIIEYNLFDVWR